MILNEFFYKYFLIATYSYQKYAFQHSYNQLLASVEIFEKFFQPNSEQNLQFHTLIGGSSGFSFGMNEMILKPHTASCTPNSCRSNKKEISFVSDKDGKKENKVTQ